MPKFKIGDKVVSARRNGEAYIILIFNSVFSPVGYLLEYSDQTREIHMEEELLRV